MEARFEPSHILLFCGSYPPRIGGYEVHIWETVRRFVKRQARVTVVTPEWETFGTVSPGHALQGVEETILTYPNLGTINGTLAIPRPGALKEALKAATIGGSIVVTETRFFPSTWMGWITASLRGLPIMHVEHGGSHPQAGNTLMNALAALVDHLAGKFLAYRVERVVATSNAVRDFLIHIGVPPAKIAVIPDGINPKIGHTAPDGIMVREGNKVRIGFVGRLVYGKGVTVLLHAFDKLSKDLPNNQLWIVGDGPARRELEGLGKALGTVGLSFLGKVDHEHVAELYEGFDIVAIPSLTEGFGLVMLEAAQHGCAIVASDLPAFAEILTPGSEFLVARRGDVEDLALRLEKLVRDESLRHSLSAAASARIRNWPDWDDTADSLWEQLCLTIASANGLASR